MAQKYRIAVIGSGPAGLSAAARAAWHDAQEKPAAPTHILLEAFDKPSKTIYQYQKGKFVMAEPGFLALRSDCDFKAGSREAVLGQWQTDIDNLAINIRYNARVTGISGSKGDFRITLGNNEIIEAEHVILGIGLEGNPRQLGVPGDDAPIIQYTLEDPEAFRGETVVVVGAGDSAIENALALARQNQVYIINRQEEFSRAKEGNRNAVLQAINDQRTALDCFYRTTCSELLPPLESGQKYQLKIDTPSGEKIIGCDRIIARLGGVPPRKFVEDCGVEFSSNAGDATPLLTAKFESTVPGLYVVGSLAGYPLIKQAMNQGYDVVEYIRGNDIQPADYPLLELQFGLLPYRREASEILDMFKQRIPMFSELNPLAFRELIIESHIWISLEAGDNYDETLAKEKTLLEKAGQQDPSPKTGRLIKAGEFIFKAGDYTNTFFTIVEGEVSIESADHPGKAFVLKRGEFFGEGSLLSGRPRTANARVLRDCILVETPRRTMLKLMSTHASVKAGIDWIFIVRALQKHFAPAVQPKDLRKLAEMVLLKTFKAGATIYEEGEPGDCLYLVRRGSVQMSRSIHGSKVVIAQKQSNELLGEMALMGDPVRRETTIATVLTETIVINRQSFLELITMDSSAIERLQSIASQHALSHTSMEAGSESGQLMGFLLAQGLGEATNVLVIDQSLCIGCDNCEKACAETHAGISRLDREAGPTFGNVHIPVSCRHCEHPYCMKDCPPDAIHRAATGEVFIDETCIGCGNCESNCPYGVIDLAYDAPKKPSLLSWMLFGRGTGPGEATGKPDAAALAKGKKAVKCDACVSQTNGAACVRACPTGAAARLGQDQFFELIAKQ